MFAREGDTSVPGLHGGPLLEAVWVGEGDRLAVVAPPHPLMGGELTNPVVQRLADALAAAGLRALLFNWRGVGESFGVPSGESEDADADYRAALAFAGSMGNVVVAAGYSFGGATALRIAAGDDFLRALAVAPPPALFSEDDVARLGSRAAIIAAESDTIAPPAELEPLVAAHGGTLVTLPQADHFFSGELSSLRRHVLSIMGP